MAKLNFVFDLSLGAYRVGVLMLRHPFTLRPGPRTQNPERSSDSTSAQNVGLHVKTWGPGTYITGDKTFMVKLHFCFHFRGGEFKSFF